QQEVTFQDGRRGDSKESFGGPIVLVQRAAPNFLSCFQIEAVQHPFGAEREQLLARDQRRRSRSLVETEIIPVVRVIAKLPALLARGRVKTFDNFFRRGAMEQNQSFTCDGYAAPARADVFSP